MLSAEQLKNWHKMLPHSLTLPAVLFFQEQERVESLRWYFFGADFLFSNHVHEVSSGFSAAFKNVDHPVAQSMAEALRIPGNAERLFQSDTYQAVLGHVLLARSADNFSTYLKDLLLAAISREPGLLKSSQKEPLDFILSFQDMGDLRSAIANKRTEALFYGGISEIASFYTDRLGIPIFADSTQEAKVEFIFRVRNLIVHNRGRLNADFLRDYPAPHLEEGAMLLFDLQDVSHYNLFFQCLLVPLDEHVAEKFQIPTFANYPKPDARLKDIRQKVVHLKSHDAP